MAKKYYKRIKNQNYDRELLEIADKAIAGRGDGQISLDDAEKILWAVKDNGEYTDIEKKTIHYIRDNYKFTKKADTWFRKEIRSWAASKKGSAKKTKPSKVKPIEVEQEQEFSPEPDPSYYQIQKPYPKKEDSSKKNRFFILASTGILILFILVYFLFSAFQKWMEKRKTEKQVTIEPVKEIRPEIEEKKSNPPIVLTEPVQKEIKPADSETEKSVSGLSKEIISSEHLLFDDSELYVNKKNRAFLRKMAEFLKENPGLKVKVIGHTCNKGTDEDNQRLSVERAESVIKYLKIQGIDPSRLTAIGEGEKKPIADNSTLKGKIQNRRVQFDFF